MAKEIINGTRESGMAESSDAAAPAVPAFEAVVFRQSLASQDFGQSEAIALPGQHSAEQAWAAVFHAMRGDGATIGGEIRRVA